MTGMIVRGWQARLYPTHAQADRLNQWAGSLRFLWNRLLDSEKAEYEATGKWQCYTLLTHSSGCNPGFAS